MHNLRHLLFQKNDPLKYCLFNLGPGHPVLLPHSGYPNFVDFNYFWNNVIYSNNFRAILVNGVYYFLESSRNSGGGGGLVETHGNDNQNIFFIPSNEHQISAT